MKVSILRLLCLLRDQLPWNSCLSYCMSWREKGYEKVSDFKPSMEILLTSSLCRRQIVTKYLFSLIPYVEGLTCCFHLCNLIQVLCLISKKLISQVRYHLLTATSKKTPWWTQIVATLKLLFSQNHKNLSPFRQLLGLNQTNVEILNHPNPFSSHSSPIQNNQATKTTWSSMLSCCKHN